MICKGVGSQDESQRGVLAQTDVKFIMFWGNPELTWHSNRCVGPNIVRPFPAVDATLATTPTESSQNETVQAYHSR
jgi:hypothetical protein